MRISLTKIVLAVFGFALALHLGCSSDDGGSIPNPDPPTGIVTSINSTNSITIGWGSVSGSTGYYIYRSTTTVGPYERIGSSTSTSYTDNNLSDGTTYYYRISGYNNGGEGSQSYYINATTLPIAPTSVTATANSTTSITISWSSVKGATGYRIYRSTASSDTYEQIGTSSTTSYTNSGLTAGTTYYYKVSAYNNGGESFQSSVISATTSLVIPSSVTGMMVTANSTTSITISWSSVAGATGYRIYRSTTSSGVYEQIGTSVATTYENTGLKENTAYFYKVSAYNSGGEGSQSNTISAKTLFTYGTVNYGTQSYKTVIIGTQTWMAENLNYNVSGSECYDQDQANCTKYGRLYNGATARTVCPTGWHLPSEAEWDVLLTAVGGSSTAAIKLKATRGWERNNGSDDYGFSALPGGKLYYNGNFFGHIGTNGFWWSSTNSTLTMSWSKYLKIGHDNSAEFSEDDNRYLSSVRCVKD